MHICLIYLYCVLREARLLLAQDTMKRGIMNVNVEK